jgi:hypothetical protein
MVKEITVTILSLLMFFLLVFAGELRGMFFGSQDVPRKKPVIASSCPQINNAADNSRRGWKVEW